MKSAEFITEAIGQESGGDCLRKGLNALGLKADAIYSDKRADGRRVKGIIWVHRSSQKTLKMKAVVDQVMRKAFGEGGYAVKKVDIHISDPKNDYRPIDYVAVTYAPDPDAKAAAAKIPALSAEKLGLNEPAKKAKGTPKEKPVTGTAALRSALSKLGIAVSNMYSDKRAGGRRVKATIPKTQEPQRVLKHALNLEKVVKAEFKKMGFEVTKVDVVPVDQKAPPFAMRSYVAVSYKPVGE